MKTRRRGTLVIRFLWPGPNKPSRRARPAGAPKTISKRQQNSPTMPLLQMLGLLELVDPRARASPAPADWPWPANWRAARPGLARHSGTLNAAASNTHNSDPPTIPLRIHSPATRLDRDKTGLLSGEHHAEDQQHQRAADIDHQLHGAPRNRAPARKEQARGWPRATARDRTPCGTMLLDNHDRHGQKCKRSDRTPENKKECQFDHGCVPPLAANPATTTSPAVFSG